MECPPFPNRYHLNSQAIVNVRICEKKHTEIHMDKLYKPEQINCVYGERVSGWQAAWLSLRTPGGGGRGTGSGKGYRLRSDLCRAVAVATQVG